MVVAADRAVLLAVPCCWSRCGQDCASPAPSIRRPWTRMRWRCSTNSRVVSRSTNRWSIATSSSSSSRRSPCRGSRSTPRPGASSSARRAASTTARRSPSTTPCSRSSGRWPPSQRAFQMRGVARRRRKVDEQTLEIEPRGARRGAAREADQPADDEQGLVGGARGRAAAGLQRQAGDLRGPQRQRHRPVPARSLRARHPHRAEDATRAGGVERQALGQRRRGDLRSPSDPTPPGWRR